ncbi:MAG: hypothetical protein U0802_16160 [Candidatus Binatia bacterium]
MSIEPSDEYMHANTGEPNFNESMYFNVYDRQARIGAFARIGNRPNERYAEMTIAVYQADGTSLFNYKRPEIAGNGAFDAGGMRFAVVEPFKHLRVSYDGHAVYLAQPLDLEDPRAAFTGNPFKPVQLELDWYGLSPMYGGTALEHSEMVFAKGHYEQHGRASGRLAVDGVAHAVEGFGLRDHSWGPRSWQSPAYYRWLIGQFDQGFGFMGSQIVTQQGSELLSGFVFRDGENHYVDRLTVHTDWRDPGHYHDRIALSLHTRAGDVEISGRVLTMLPLRNRRDGKVTRISEGLTEWRCGDHVGYGWSEYLDQIA